jgi:hypothetical protein
MVYKFSFPMYLFFCFLDDCHSVSSEKECQWSSDLHFLSGDVVPKMLNISHILIDQLYFFALRIAYSIHLPIY